ncbi:MAG: hypothetical protein DRJ52_05645 [Thermoprotei archaeon]|nr:MAG: hypothetical protein DRJ52_05645 [Thermoprotei archaeon]RLE98796.1 MAG: hypothetical protein DRJ63_07205 [Thermoprotei archaeon]HDI75436.1 hypothetical protein [Thermoprotei archaeon]
MKNLDVLNYMGFYDDSLEKLDEFIQKRVGDVYPGAVIAIGCSRGLGYCSAYGYSLIIGEKLPMKENTIFDLASLTKPVATATSIMILVEKGKIYLDEGVQDILPSFKGLAKEKVTLKHLLTHTSGLPAHIAFYRWCSSAEEVVNEICSKVSLVYEPGTRVVYSDLGYILLGYIIEKISGERLDLFAREKIFNPLGMKDTMFNPPEKLRSRIAATELCKWRKKLVWGEVHDENSYAMGGVAGHAGLFSTALDLAIFAQMMLNKGSIGSTRVLSRRSVEVMTTCHTEGLESRRGLGWQLKHRGAACGDLFSEDSYGHTGFTGTSIWIDPQQDLFVTFLTNRVHPSRENTKIVKFRPKLHNFVVGLRAY